MKEFKDMQVNLYKVSTDYDTSYKQMQQQEKEGPFTRAWEKIKKRGKFFYPLLLFPIISGIFLGITLVGQLAYITLHSLPYVLAGGATLGGVGAIYGGSSAAAYYYGYSRKDPKDPRKGSIYKSLRNFFSEMWKRAKRKGGSLSPYISEARLI